MDSIITMSALRPDAGEDCFSLTRQHAKPHPSHAVRHFLSLLSHLTTLPGNLPAAASLSGVQHSRQFKVTDHAYEVFGMDNRRQKRMVDRPRDAEDTPKKRFTSGQCWGS